MPTAALCESTHHSFDGDLNTFEAYGALEHHLVQVQDSLVLWISTPSK